MRSSNAELSRSLGLAQCFAEMALCKCMLRVSERSENVRAILQKEGTLEPKTKHPPNGIQMVITGMFLP